MDFKDKPKFKAIMDRMASHFGQPMIIDQLEFYFEELQGYSLPQISEAVNIAIDLRDPADKFLRNKMLSISEIRVAMDVLDERMSQNRKVGCKECSWTGWMTSKDSQGRLVAWPCSCLYEEAKKAREKKKRIGSIEEKMDHYRDQVINCYEAHQKKYGDLAVGNITKGKI